MLAGVVVFAISAASQGEVELVKDGRPVSEIVIAPDAIQVVKLAAQDLQEHLKQMSGAELPIVQAPSPSVASQVYVGESPFTRELGFQPAAFSTSGFEILGKTTARPDGFPSPGLRKWQEFCGYKFTTQHLDDHLGQWNPSLQIHSNDDTGTSLEQQQLHPEWLACGADGQPYVGYPPGRGVPRYTDPGFRKAAVTYMNKVFDTFPDLSAMTVGPPDGGVKMDARDLDEIGPSETYPWGIQVGRTRFTGGTGESWSIAPTGGPYATLNRWANLWIRPW